MPVCGVRATPLLKTIPASCEKSDFLKRAFCPKPIVKFIAGTITTLKINFICAAPDFLVTWHLAYRGLICAASGRCCVYL
jgi:hypothetical protein